MSLRRRAAIALVAIIALSPAVVAVQSATAANVAPFVGVSLYADSYLDKTLGGMQVGVPYSDSITRGPGLDDWERYGTMPDGLTGAIVGDDFVISGTPTTAGDYTLSFYNHGVADDGYMVFYITVVDANPAALRGLLDVGVGSHPAPYAPGETFGVWYEYVNDSTTNAAINPTMVITYGPGVTNLGGSAQGDWVCTGTQTVTCTLDGSVAPGETNVGYTSYVQLNADYAKSTFTITNTVSATNSAAAAYTATVRAALVKPTVSVSGPMPYSTATVTAYAPDGQTSGSILFYFTNGIDGEGKWATVGPDGSATYSGSISSVFSGTYVSVSPTYYDSTNLPTSVGDPATFYAYRQLNMAGTFYLNGAVYTGPVKLYVYSDWSYDGSSGAFIQYAGPDNTGLTGGTYDFTPYFDVSHSYYSWATLLDLGGAQTFFNFAGEYQPNSGDQSTIGTRNFTSSMNYYWESAPTFTDTEIAQPRQNVAYTDAVEATSNVDVDYLISSGALPTGLSLDSETGAVTGTATVLGQAYSFQVTADNGYMTSLADFSGTVLEEHIAPTWADDTLGEFRYNTTVTDGVAASGDPTIAYEVSDGELPTGVTLDPANGQLAGAPTVLGEDYDFELHAYSDWGDVYAPFSGEVLPPIATPVWTDSEIGELRVGETLIDGVSASGEPAPAYTSLDLPSWMTLNAATGAISATPTAAGPYDFTITAASTAGTVSQQFTGTIEAAWIAPTFTDGEILQLQGGVYLDDQVVATGDGPITYSVPLGALPAWLTLDAATGLISGTAPLSAVGEPYSFTVTATGHGTDSVTISGVVRAAPWGGLEPAFEVGDIAAGAEFDYGVSGAGDSAPFSVTVNSTPVIVASGTTSSLGSASGLGAIPSSITAGAHSIVLLTYASDGTPRTTTLWFTVLRDGTIGAISLLGPLTYSETGTAALASTGLDMTPGLAAALLLLVLGASLRRRRRT